MVSGVRFCDTNFTGPSAMWLKAQVLTRLPAHQWMWNEVRGDERGYLNKRPVET